MKDNRNTESQKKLLSQIRSDIEYKKYHKAIENIDKYQDLYGRNEYLELAIAKYNYAIGEKQDAIEMLEELISKKAKNIGYVIYELGKIYEKEKNNKKAIEIYKKIDNVNHEDKKHVYMSLGILLEKEHCFEDAIYYFEKMILNKGKLVGYAKYHLAKIYTYMDQLELAEEMLKDVYSDKDDDLQASIVMLKAKICKKRGYNEEYKTKIDDVLTKYNPNSIAATIEKISILLKENNIKEAKKFFSKIESLEDDAMNYMLVKALYYEKTNNYELAEKLYKKITYDPDSVTTVNISEAKFGLCRINIMKNRLDEAITNCKEIIEYNDLYHNGAIIQLIEIYIYASRYKEAFELLKQINEEKLVSKDRGQLYRIVLMFNKIFDIPCVYEENMSYSKKQIIHYEKDKAINHIVYGHKICSNENESLFNDDINISLLIDEIKDKLTPENLYEIATMKKYKIYYPNIGNYKGNRLDYLIVVTLLYSDDIITMYASNEYMEQVVELKTEAKKTLTKMSRIDKFNQKYGM